MRLKGDNFLVYRQQGMHDTVVADFRECPYVIHERGCLTSDSGNAHLDWLSGHHVHVFWPFMHLWEDETKF
jgi:hypothetical protein